MLLASLPEGYPRPPTAPFKSQQGPRIRRSGRPAPQHTHHFPSGCTIHAPQGAWSSSRSAPTSRRVPRLPPTSACRLRSDCVAPARLICLILYKSCVNLSVNWSARSLS